MVLYEIGYLLTPLIPSDKIDGEISVLRKVIEDKKGLITDEGRAKIQKLAYTINKLDSTYFGWIQFVADPTYLPEIKNSFDKVDNIVRFLITKPEKEKIGKKKDKKIVSKTKEPKEEIKEEEVDQKIEELIK